MARMRGTRPPLQAKDPAGMRELRRKRMRRDSSGLKARYLRDLELYKQQLKAAKDTGISSVDDVDNFVEAARDDAVEVITRNGEPIGSVSAYHEPTSRVFNFNPFRMKRKPTQALVRRLGAARLKADQSGNAWLASLHDDPPAFDQAERELEVFEEFEEDL